MQAHELKPGDTVEIVMQQTDIPTALTIAQHFTESLRFPNDVDYSVTVDIHPKHNRIEIAAFVYDDTDLTAALADTAVSFLGGWRKGFTETSLRGQYKSSLQDLDDTLVSVTVHDMTNPRPVAPLVTTFLANQN